LTSPGSTCCPNGGQRLAAALGLEVVCLVDGVGQFKRLQRKYKYVATARLHGPPENFAALIPGHKDEGLVEILARNLLSQLVALLVFTTEDDDIWCQFLNSARPHIGIPYLADNRDVLDEGDGIYYFLCQISIGFNNEYPNQDICHRFHSLLL